MFQQELLAYIFYEDQINRIQSLYKDYTKLNLEIRNISV